MFTRFDPLTTLSRQQWSARLPARANLARLRNLLEATIEAQKTAPVPIAVSAPPAGGAASARPAIHEAEDTSKVAVRGEVESVLATLGELPLASSDLKLAGAWLDNVLTGLDADVVDYARALALVRDLETAFGRIQGEEPPGIVWIVVLGSLLGMITITIHLNWKFRNRWDTAGFVPWYLTRLVAAPVVSLAVAGLLTQVRFTNDTAAANSIASLGLLGASPLFTFATAIVTGLFSNRMYEWLRDTALGATVPKSPPPASAPPQGGPQAPTTQSYVHDSQETNPRGLPPV
jgi:hypothetical protein